MGGINAEYFFFFFFFFFEPDCSINRHKNKEGKESRKEIFHTRTAEERDSGFFLGARVGERQQRTHKHSDDTRQAQGKSYFRAPQRGREGATDQDGENENTARATREQPRKKKKKEKKRKENKTKQKETSALVGSSRRLNEKLAKNIFSLLPH